MDDSTTLPWSGKAVLLLDLDAFFASVEQLDHPQWRGKPVIVGGDASRRGVVSTCSYEARRFGVRSAMPASTAARLCPDAIWVSGNFARYREMSAHVMSIMTDESPFIQQVSIDEAFLDVTPSKYNTEHPLSIALRIQKRVEQLGITCSIGLGTSKTVAKIASDMDKPQGLTAVYPGREKAFLSPLPVKVMSGIGPVAQEKLIGKGILTLGDVAEAGDGVLAEVFGKNAQMMRNRCLGLDDSEVTSDDERKSISNEISFAENITERQDLEAAIRTVAAKVARRLRMKGLRASALSLKLKSQDLKTRSATEHLVFPADTEDEFDQPLMRMLDRLWDKGEPVRLVGAQAFSFGEDGPTQLTLDGLGAQGAEESSRAKDLIEATDAVRDKFGEGALSFGREVRTKGNLTGSSSKNPADYK